MIVELFDWWDWCFVGWKCVWFHKFTFLLFETSKWRQRTNAVSELNVVVDLKNKKSCSWRRECVGATFYLIENVEIVSYVMEKQVFE